MISIDEKSGVITISDERGSRILDLNEPEAFQLISDLWLRSGWGVKHVYTFTWLGRPMIQLPEDMLRMQEVIWQGKPDVIIETGVAHGGSLVFYASLCRLLEKGRVIGIDVEIRPHNRKAIEEHPLSPLITLIEGSSTDPATVSQVSAALRPGETVMVMLDSAHHKAHVLAELEAYAPLVSRGSWIVAMDGGMMELAVGGPRTAPDWSWNNPRKAAEEFARKNPSFHLEEPPFSFNESTIMHAVSYWGGGWLRRIS